MKKIALITFLLLLCVTTVGAYSFQFIGPPKESGNLNGYVGEIILVEGISDNIPPGVTMALIVSGPSNYYLNQPFVIQSGGIFSVPFESENLKEGTYRFEIRSHKDYPLGSARNWFILNLIDRRHLLTVTSPVRQEYTGRLFTSGTVQDLGSEGIELKINGQTGVIFGPEWIATDSQGRFSHMVDIYETGVYTARISDRKGLINKVQIEVFREVATTQSIPVSPPSTKIISASATTSRENPAYFIMRTLSGPVTLSTSLGIDWVIEYIDESGQKHIVNDFGPEKAETVALEGRGGTIYIRAYPDGGESGTVHLYGQNVVTLTVSATPLDQFGDLQVSGHTAAEESPIPVFLSIIALAVVVLFMGKKP